MKPDDRDIICQQDYAPLSNAELLTQIEQHTAIMYTSPIIDFDLEWIIGPARALLARAEAAEALAYERLENMLFAEQRANDAANDATDAELHLRRAEQAAEQLTAENRRLAARVAELEAAQAAQGWRPLDAPPAAPGEYLIGADYIPDVRLAEYHADTDMWYQQLPDGEWQLADWATHWRPLPAPPQEPPQ